jgi:protein tyrosine phosphatase (PTP) superfamily phosphohydrolase (DUF442 family)
MNRWAVLLQLILLMLPVAGCRQPSPAPAKVEAKGLHNVYRITDKLISGSSPEGEEGFRSLKELGIKTIISMEDARPDLEHARKYGLRYVHLPTENEDLSRPQILRLAKAVRDLPGPVYLHCHHGKHRGPVAAAAIHFCLDEKCSVEQAVAQMKLAGADPRYIGLYQGPEFLVRPSKQEMDQIAADFPEVAAVQETDQIAADFPEVAAVSSLGDVMVQIAYRWKNLNHVRSAGWQVPANHPDLDPPHEALQLAEHYREAGRLEKVVKSSNEFRRWLRNAEQEAKELERTLRNAKEKGVDRTALDEAYRKASSSCVQCHAKYPNVPPED